MNLYLVYDDTKDFGNPALISSNNEVSAKRFAVQQLRSKSSFFLESNLTVYWIGVTNRSRNYEALITRP